jgi:peptide/nickel transport system substrate-binding protein
MKFPSRRVLAFSAAVLTSLSLISSCAKSSGTATSAKVLYGGTLRIVADGGPEDNLDPVPSYTLANYILERAFARQLLTYVDADVTGTSGASWQKSIALVPDAAIQVPTRANGGVSDGGLVYTFHLRAGLTWNSTPPRPVVAGDFIREFKAFCNPVSPVGNASYYTQTIVGFASYCNAEDAYFGAKNAPAATAAAVAAFQNAHAISGVSAPDPSTLVFRLTEPASDFDNIMALPFVSARPVEYDSYLPGSAQLGQHLMSDGPYQFVSWDPGKQIVMDRNPAWKQSSDPVRHQYVSKIVVTMGTSSNQAALTDLQAGNADLELDLGVPATAIPSLRQSAGHQLHIWPASNTSSYVVMNLRSPDAGGAMSKLAVRQAIAYAVDKSDIQRILGGPQINKILSTAIPPGSAGYAPYNPYPSPGDQGNPSACRRLLASAGYPHGLSLVYLYLDNTTQTAVYTSIQSSLAKCGITLTGKSQTGATYFTSLGDAPQNDKPGQWDMATGSWYPDWFGDNGRSIVPPLFQTDCQLNTVNAGCYSNPAVDHLISEALKAPTESAAAPLWQQADQIALKAVAIIPLIDQYVVQFASGRVHSATGDGTANVSEQISGPDITNIWLNPNHP